ncbi:peroxiredoxin [Arthrobacter alpinus]|uniref:peroxiredoxin n=1 Tax=Arthrobacter alpinus TaxID=656366 RepID=UPI0005CA1670|nr:peroxiredoxin [Arthrobacter alpinus]ALV45000.1 peroxiredoxin [Arthrobacter alpinus]
MKLDEKVPDFALPDQHGTLRTLAELTANGPLVIFFYPRAGSGGCTTEACHFRDLQAEFAAAGASIVGISTDAEDVQLQFATKNSLTYPLLSDRNGAVADLFRVRRRLLAKSLPIKRSTFIVDSQGILRFAVSSETNMELHADQALAALATLA